MEDHTPMPKAYEAPSLTELGGVHKLTQDGHGHGKGYGHADGFSFAGLGLTNSS
jgi:hypothetical protein